MEQEIIINDLKQMKRDIAFIREFLIKHNLICEGGLSCEFEQYDIMSDEALESFENSLNE